MTKLNLKIFNITKLFVAMFLALYIFNIPAANARIFERCELANDLLARGASQSEVLEWVCIAEFESSFNTKAINKNNVDGSWDWGLFQINDRYWCDGGKETKNVCCVDCNAFLGHDIGSSFRCAQIVKRAHGYSGWVAWNHHCQGDVESKRKTRRCF